MDQPPSRREAAPSHRSDQRGVSLSVWTAVALPAFIVVVGIGADLSGHAMAQQEARAVAAEAARAATHEVILTADGPQLNRAAALRKGASFAAAAGYRAHVGIEGSATAVVGISGSYTTTFLSLVGIESIPFAVVGEAVAITSVDGERS